MKKFYLIIMSVLVFGVMLSACADPQPLLVTSSSDTTTEQNSQANSGENTVDSQGVEEVEESSSIDTEPVQAYTTTLEDIKAKGTLVIGVDGAFKPVSYTDESGALVGFDIDLATEICNVLGVTPEFKIVNWTEKENALNTGEIDCLMGGLIANEERAQQMNLSSAYLSNILMVLSNPDVTVSSAANLAGLSIGIQSGRTITEVAESNFIYDSIKNDIVEYPSYDQILTDLDNKILDCTIVPSVYGMYHNLTLGNIYSSSIFDFGDAPIVIGTRKADVELSAAIDEALINIMAEESFVDMHMKWFNMDIFMIR